MKYLNTRTGNIIDAPCVIKGGDWEPVSAPGAPPGKAKETDEPAKARASRKQEKR